MCVHSENATTHFREFEKQRIIDTLVSAAIWRERRCSAADESTPVGGRAFWLKDTRIHGKLSAAVVQLALCGHIFQLPGRTGSTMDAILRRPRTIHLHHRFRMNNFPGGRVGIKTESHFIVIMHILCWCTVAN